MIIWLMALAVASEPVLIDAGNLVDPPLIGFDRLSLEGCDDDRVTWSSPPSRVRLRSAVSLTPDISEVGET